MELRKKVELVLNDKSYLTKENISLSENKLNLQSKIEYLEKELTVAKNQNTEYLKTLLSQKDQYSQSFENKINSELCVLKENHKSELH